MPQARALTASQAMALSKMARWTPKRSLFTASKNPTPTTKPNVPLLFGTMGIGDKGTNGNRVHDKAQAQNMLNVLRQHRVTELDTARVYCNNTTERWIKGLNTSGMSIDTKVFPVQPGDHAPAKLRQSLETSLTELGGKKVRVLYLHAPDRSIPMIDTLHEVHKLHQEGKFEQFGLSNFAAWEVASVVELTRSKGYVQPTIYQGMYNAIMRSIEEELVPACRHYGLRIVAYNPLAGGLFSGKVPYVHAEPTEKGTRFDSHSQQGQMYRERYLRPGFFAALKILQRAVELHNAQREPLGENLPLTEVALRWLQWHSMLTPSDGVIIGASSPQQLESNLLASSKGPLPTPVLQALDQGWMAAKATAPLYWR